MAASTPAIARTSCGGDAGVAGAGPGVTEEVIVMVMDDVAAPGVIPLDAETVNVYVPAVVGVPESTPFEAKTSPGGNVPLPCVNVIGVVPDAVKEYVE